MATTYLTDATPETTALSVTQAQLCWQNADGETRTLLLANGPTTIGGGPRCAVQLDTADALPLHCVIQCDGENVTVRRWASGAVLNGCSFTESLLRPGDTLTVAGVEIKMEAAPADMDATSVLSPAAPLSPYAESASLEPSAENERLRVALQTARGRVHAVLDALREERAANQQAQSSIAQATANRDELATKLLIVTTELHDCRSELEQVRADFATASGDQDDHRRLYEMALEEIDELEQQVASLRSEHEALLAEQTDWSTQREQLEAAIVALESRINQSEFNGPQVGEPEQLTVEFEAANDDTDTDSDSDINANGLSWEGVSVAEAAGEQAIGEEVIDDETANEQAAAAFNWGVETPTADEHSVSELVEQPSGQEPSEQESTDNPWAGAWGVEGNESVSKAADATTETPSDEQQVEAVNNWLTGFASEPMVPVANEPGTVDSPVEETVEETVEEVAPYEAPETDEFTSVGDTLVDPDTQTGGEAEAVFEPSEPESVEDLIADEQPSSEAPVSFIDQFADKLPADEFPTDEVESPAFVEPVVETPQPEPITLEEGEESIEDYMAKLMQRMRGDEDACAIPAAPMAALASSADLPKPPVDEPQDEVTPEPVTPLTNLDELRSGPAPEQGHDMSSLRALANQTARHAVGVSEVKHDQEQAMMKLIISIAAMGCSGFLAATAPSLLDWSVLVGIAGFGWSAYWCYGTFQLLLKARATAASTAVPQAEPMEPTQTVELQSPITPVE